MLTLCLDDEAEQYWVEILEKEEITINVGKQGASNFTHKGPKVAKLRFWAIYQSSPCCKRITVVHLLD